MAFNDLERKRIEKALTAYVALRRPPPEIRPQLDLGWRMDGQSVVLFETRPVFDDATRLIDRPFAKATFNRRQYLWKIFWLRQDLKWHGYTPHLLVKSVEAFLKVVEEDAYGCFWG
jgi:hypothetical protein